MTTMSGFEHMPPGSDESPSCMKKILSVCDIPMFVERSRIFQILRQKSTASFVSHQHQPDLLANAAPRPARLPLLIHYHIFKNAGSSFEWALQQALGARFASFDSPSPRGFVSAKDLADFVQGHPDVAAVSSHQVAPPAPMLEGRKVWTSILIRDPLARIRSVYAFERRQKTSSPGALKAKELDFKGYVDWRLKTSPGMFCNYQVHFCSRAEAPQRRSLGPEHLKRAIAHLDMISIVGTVARYDDWLALAQKLLAQPFPGIMLQSSRQNATVTESVSEAAILDQLVDDLGESIVQHLIENNQLDMCLHQIADASLTHKLAEEGIEISLAQAYAQALENRQRTCDQRPCLRL